MFNSFFCCLSTAYSLYHTFCCLSSIFLSFLKLFYLTENFFRRFSFSNFCIISYRLTFVKNFFNFFEILFSQVVRFWPSATFISYHRFKCLSRTFLSFLKNFLNFIFQKFSSFLSATFTSYHRWSCLSRTFFIFLKNFFKFLSSSSATSDIIPYTLPLVNNFLQKNSIFLYFLFTMQT